MEENGEMVQICALAELMVDEPRRFEVAGQAIAVVRDAQDHVYAIGDRCSHGDVSLSEGFVEGNSLECWAHGARFCLRTGAALSLPAYTPVPAYRVEIREGNVFLSPLPLPAAGDAGDKTDPAAGGCACAAAENSD